MHPNANDPRDARSFPQVERDEADTIYRPDARFALFEESLLVADSKTATDPNTLAEFVRGLNAAGAAKEPAPVGLALSGGGIRSATFSLGVIQALARAKRLAAFDYLSTVSGGGYIGSWLSAWIQRTSLATVQRDLARSGPSESGPMRSSEPEQVAWLRRYSNYLAPRVGLLSTDSLTLIAVWLRNVFLNLIVIVSFLGCVLLLPKALIPTTIVLKHHGAALAHAAAFLGLLFMPVAIAWNLSERGRQKEGRWPWLVSTSGVLVTVLLPGTLAAIAGSIWLFGTSPQDPFNIGAFVAATVFLLCACAVPWCIQVARGQQPDWPHDLVQGLIFFGAFIIAAVPAAGILALTHALLGSADDGVREIATLMTVGPPIFLFAFGVGGSIYVGLVGRAYFERSREWWGRMNAGFFTYGALWFVILFSALFVPALTHWAIASAPGWLTALTSLGWVGSLIAALGSKRNANLSQAGRYNLMQVLNIAAFVFIAGFIVLTSVATERLVTKAAGVEIVAPPEVSQLSLLDLRMKADGSAMQSRVSVQKSSSPQLGPYIGAHMDALDEVMHTAFPWLGIPFLWGAFAVALGIFALFGWRVDVNKFSLHNLYKNRLIRCYLGASNIERNAQPFTGFDDGDDFPLRQLGGTPPGEVADPPVPAQRPFHIINTTLNLAQGKNLAWQERKGASFVLTPRYCGFSLSNVQGDSTEMDIRGIPRQTAGGTSAPEGSVTPDPDADGVRRYRPTRYYASRDSEERGFSLGMAMATSGAAASPNMGPATRPALAFVMTLFNARLGRWSPNPAMHKWQRSSPRFGLWCLLAELFGLSNEESSFVYLSDGGHFDNMGLYELIRRKCSTIWLVDAAADVSRTFEDLGRSIRQCRIDFGVEIDLPLTLMRATNPKGLPAAAYCQGSIDYGDGIGTGTLIYIKPTLCNQRQEPQDLLAYAARNPTFPQQTTADQFYDESEFESYRRLGEHIAGQCIVEHGDSLPTIALGDPQPTVPSPPPSAPASMWKLFQALLISAVLGFVVLLATQREFLSCDASARLREQTTPAAPMQEAGLVERALYSAKTRDLEVLSSTTCGQVHIASALASVGIQVPDLERAQLWLWADNLWIVVYSALFVTGIVWLRPRSSRPWLHRLVGLLMGAIALGAVCDYGENFLLLGDLTSPGDLENALAEAAPFTAAKFLLFAINGFILVAFSLRAWIKMRSAKAIKPSGSA